MTEQPVPTTDWFTLPLPSLIQMLQPLPEIKRAGESLRYISVYDVNIGVKRPNISWMCTGFTFQNRNIFYRVGFPMNFSSAVVPVGCSSMYVEVAVLPDEYIPEQILLEKIYGSGLERSKFFKIPLTS